MITLPQQLWDLRTAFRAQGFDLKLVGGCVRDHMLGLTPKDVDLHTDATPEECVAIYQAAGVRHELTGVDHGTISVIFDHVSYEITSLREDVATDGRRAVVKYTRDWLTDLERRDFTFNAMSASFEGDVFDPFGGTADLRAGVVRFVGDAGIRIQEDYLRILRWFRFRGRFGMVMDAQAEAAVRHHVAGLQHISRERVWMEMHKILSGDHAVPLLRDLKVLGVDAHVNLSEDKGMSTMWTDDFVEHVHENTRNPITVLVAACGQHAAQVLKTWKASSAEIQMAEFLWNNWDIVKAEHALTVGNVCRTWAVELCVLNNAEGPDCAFRKAVLEAWDPPAFPVTGTDLLELGMKPGPLVGQMLHDLKMRWANQDYMPSKQDLLEVVQSRM